MTGRCSTHQEAAAVYECDGCGKLLCEGCIEVGHRLLFCRHCGELAVPLAGAPATTSELAQEHRVRAAYGFADALSYPFRGLGLYLYTGYVLLVMLLEVAGGVPGLGCAVLIVQLVILLLLPGFLFAIVRTSAEGETELPDWPDFAELGERLGECLSFVLLTAMAFLPTWLLLYLTDCGVDSLLHFGLDVFEAARCWSILALGVAVGVT